MEPRRRPARARSLGAPAPCSPATSPAQYPAGSGVGVNVWLRQAHGFEGFRSCGEGAPPYALPVPQPIDVPELLRHLHPAARGVPPRAEGCNRQFSKVVHLENFDAVVRPDGEYVLPPAADTVVSVKVSLDVPEART